MGKYKNILVTGGAGFIGSHMVELLIYKKYNVTVLDNLSFGIKSWIHKKAKFVKGDITSAKTCILATKKIDAVFHFAAMSRAAPSINAMDLCINQNVIGTKNILEACRINKVKKIIYAGSSTYYGNIRGKQNEKLKGNFINPYALSKYLGEEICFFYNKNYNLSCNVMRYFNVYGPRQPSKGMYALVVGIFLNRLKKNKPLIIHGSGNQKRDFIHVKDIAEANLASLKSNIDNQVFNVGYGKNYSINHVAKLISINKSYTKRRKGDATETLADISKIKKSLNWKPKISLEKGIKQLIK